MSYEYALIKDGVVEEYRTYDDLVESKKIDGKPMLRLVNRMIQPTFDAKYFYLEELITVNDTTVDITFNVVAKPLDIVKATKKLEINQVRDQLEASGFSYLNKVFDSDAQSIKRLYGAAMAAQVAVSGGAIPTDVFVTWTTADGSTVDMTYQDAIMLPVVMAAVGNQLHTQARDLKAQVDAATTVEGVVGIVW